MDLFQGGFLSALWDKVPGDSLSEKYFWDLERDACNAIRREFRRVNESVITLHSLLYHSAFIGT